MRRDHEAALPLLQPREIVERANPFSGIGEIEQQHVPALNRSFDTPDQNDAALGRVRRQPAQVELPLVEGDGERTVSERCRPIDEIDTGMRDSIDWIVSGMRVELDFQHR